MSVYDLVKKLVSAIDAERTCALACVSDPYGLIAAKSAAAAWRDTNDLLENLLAQTSPPFEYPTGGFLFEMRPLPDDNAIGNALGLVPEPLPELPELPELPALGDLPEVL